MAPGSSPLMSAGSSTLEPLLDQAKGRAGQGHILRGVTAASAETAKRQPQLRWAGMGDKVSAKTNSIAKSYPFVRGLLIRALHTYKTKQRQTQGYFQRDLNSHYIVYIHMCIYIGITRDWKKMHQVSAELAAQFR